MMVMHSGVSMPGFWRRNPAGLDRLSCLLLSPVGFLYALIVYCRFAIARAAGVGSRIICVGNVVVGGTGKTPVCLALGRHAAGKGLNVQYLTRGYGGSETGPILVDASTHNAAAVGDEALLLAEVAPTWVAKDRAAGARQAAAHGAELIIMDDGLQNPTIEKSYTLLVVDGTFGFGNGLPMPAGPLREFRSCAYARSDRCLMVGQDESGLSDDVGARLPLNRVEMRPVEDLSRFAEKRLVAFAGIGRPEKFFAMLGAAGLELSNTVGFSDHHMYTDKELAALREMAEQNQAVLVTTTKDYVRLPGAFRKNVETVSVELCFTDHGNWEAVLNEALSRG